MAQPGTDRWPLCADCGEPLLEELEAKDQA